MSPEIPGDAQAAGDAPLTIHSAASAIGALLADDGDSGASETEQKEPVTSEAEETAEQSEEAEAEEQSETAESEDQSEKQPEKYRVKVEDFEAEVTLDELIRGYQREQDYSRKTMKVAEAEKSAEAERQALATAREQYSNLVGAIQAELSKPLYDPAEMDALKATDPQTWAVRQLEEQQRQGQLNAVVAEQEKILRQKQAEADQANAKRLADENEKLLKAVPEWKDGNVRKAELGKIWDYGLSLGYTAAELGAFDHRAMLGLRDAVRYRDIQSKKPEVQAKVEAVKTVKPGTASQQPSKVTQYQRAHDRHSKDGNVRTAAALIALMNSKG